MITSQEVTKVFLILLEEIIAIEPYKSKCRNIYKEAGFDTSLGTLLLLCLCLLSLLLAYVSRLLKSPILPSKEIFLLLFVSYFLILLLLQIPVIYRNIKNTREQVIINFTKNKYQAEGREWRIANKLAKNSNFSKEVLEIVKIRINYSIENIEDIAKVKRIANNIYAIIFVIVIICAYTPNNVLSNTLKSDNIKLLPGILAVLSVLVAGINLVRELFFASSLQTEISKLKKCLCLIEQAKLLIDSISKDD